MAVSVTIAGVSYAFPQTGDSSWGDAVTNWAIAVSSKLLQKSGGSFVLTAEVDFGATYGLKSAYFKSRAANPATTGVGRLGNAEGIYWRNAANNANLGLLVNASDQLTYNDDVLITTTGTLTASRALVTDSGGSITSSSVTSTELGYLSGVTSPIQTQLNGKQATGNYITALTGDVAASGPGSASATIQNNVVTNAKAAQMAANTIKGNNTGGTANASDLTTTQVKAMLNTAPTVQRFTSGSGTYTLPAGVLYIEVEMCGGGGGGGGGGSSGGGTGGNGGTTTFGSSLLTCTGGNGANANQASSTVGTATVNSPAVTLVALSGSIGQGGNSQSSGANSVVGGCGGASGFGVFGGGGSVGPVTGSAPANSGGGGGGGASGGVANSTGGAGGNGGGYLRARISSPSSTYSYSVGAGATGGTAGSNGAVGGDGAAGIIIVTEYYQ